MGNVHKQHRRIKRSSTTDKGRGKRRARQNLIDQREQLFNDGKTGPIDQVSLPEAMITSLRGILLDCDPKWIRDDLPPVRSRDNPTKFYNDFIQKLLTRHPVLNKAEVRVSGQGLHLIIWFKEPVEFKTEGDRQRWAAIVKVIQRVLPTDPDCPGITALTRPVGSVNGKNGAIVRRLRKGEAVPAEAVLGLFDLVRTSPFRTIARLLFGSEQIRPCPVCSSPGSMLSVLDVIGKCYGHCGKVSIGRLFDVFLRPRPAKNQ